MTVEGSKEPGVALKNDVFQSIFLAKVFFNYSTASWRGGGRETCM